MRAATVPLLFTAYDLQAAVHFLRSEGANSAPRWSTPRAPPSAAPTYFEPLQLGDAPLVDGGVFADQPGAVRLRRGARQARPPALARARASSPARCPTARSRTGASSSGRGRSIDVVFDGGQDAVDLQLDALMDAGYVRLQTRLEEASDDLDDASEENLAALSARPSA